jgi:hypothetical protein
MILETRFTACRAYLPLVFVDAVDSIWKGARLAALEHFLDGLGQLDQIECHEDDFLRFFARLNATAASIIGIPLAAAIDELACQMGIPTVPSYLDRVNSYGFRQVEFAFYHALEGLHALDIRNISSNNKPSVCASPLSTYIARLFPNLCFGSFSLALRLYDILKTIPTPHGKWHNVCRFRCIANND